jgi:hypothetical protein
MWDWAPDSGLYVYNPQSDQIAAVAIQDICAGFDTMLTAHMTRRQLGGFRNQVLVMYTAERLFCHMIPCLFYHSQLH